MKNLLVEFDRVNNRVGFTTDANCTPANDALVLGLTLAAVARFRSLACLNGRGVIPWW
jgi:hypothetical protein